MRSARAFWPRRIVEGMLPGIYYRVQRHVDAVAQADQFVNRAMSLARGRSWNAPALLLCGDFDGDLPLSSILRFMDRVEARAGVVPVAYLENSTQLKQTLSGADAASKAMLRRMPYWLALYAHDSGAGPVYPAPVNPQRPAQAIRCVVQLDDVAIWWRGLGRAGAHGPGFTTTVPSASPSTSVISTARRSAMCSTVRKRGCRAFGGGMGCHFAEHGRAFRGPHTRRLACMADAASSA